MRWLVMLLVPVALAACEVGRLKLPMTLGQRDAAPVSCPGISANGDCKSPPALSSTQETQ